MSHRRPEGLTPPLWFSAQFGTLLLLGPIPATLVAGVGSARHIIHKHEFASGLVSTATVMVATFAAGLLFNRLGGMPGYIEWWLTVLVATTVVGYCVVKGGLTFASRSIASRSVDRSWMQTTVHDLRNCLISASAAVLIVHAINQYLWGPLSFLVLPLAFVYWAVRDTARRDHFADQQEAVIESLEEGACVLDCDGRVTMWNAAIELMLKCPRGQAIGRSLTAAVPLLVDTTVAKAVDTPVAPGSDPRVLRLMLPAAVGATVLQVKIVSHRRGVTLVWEDVTDGSRADRELKQSEERLALMESSITDGLWEWDLRGQAVRFSAQWKSIVGLAPASTTGPPEEWFDRVHAEDLESLTHAIDTYLAGQSEELIHQHRLRHEDGTYRHVLCRGLAVRDGRQRPVRLGGSLTDVSDRTEAERPLGDTGSRDPLTGLNNRSVFVEALGHRLNALRKRQGGHFAVLFLDLDRFKVINDSLGHLVGDELLIEVSRRLESCLRDGDSLARLGGDEFAIFLNELRDEAQANAVAFRIQEAFRAAFLIGGREVFTSTSIGIAFSAFRYESPDDIMRDADTAMYHAKAKGRARFEVFDAHMHEQALDRIGLEKDLRQALRNNAFDVHYQPIVSLNSGVCVGFEAFVRWSRNGKAVSPATFIPVAEELGLMDALGTWVLRAACRSFAEWQRRFPESGFDCITVNVSPRQLVQQGFLGTVEGAIRDAELTPGHLRLEITETAVLSSLHSTAALLAELRNLGVKIYLDDFGTGHSSLSHLHQLPVDALKIDRSFVASLLLPDRPAIVESILALAYTLGTGVVAEGVEDELQALELERLGCRHAQGFLFSPPIPAAKIEELLASGEPIVASRRLMVDSAPSSQLPWANRPEAVALKG
jgi:diguanylate cyclase (GGDEF)-like protein/PAS domain S-box-containing protein